MIVAVVAVVWRSGIVVVIEVAVVVVLVVQLKL